MTAWKGVSPAVLRALCLASAVAAAVIFIADIPGDYRLLRTVCHPGPTDDCHNPQLTPQLVRQLHHLGLSADAFALYFLALAVLIVAVFMVVGLLVLRSSPRSLEALLAALFLVTFGTTFVGTDAVTAHGSPWRVPALILTFVASASLIGFLCLFPTGRFRPRWTAGLAALGILLALATSWPDAPFAALAVYQVGSVLGLLVLLTGVIAALVYRYRKLASPVERQQTKVAVIGIVATILLFGALTALATIDNKSGGLGDTMISNSAFEIVPCFVPLSLGIAMLRYRLWDVDILINRTLVYGSLTIALGLLYIAGVVGLQALFRVIAGQSSDLAIVISTLTIAALFQPLRHGMQTSIDRRFYRRKYDAARTIARFSERVRDDVDLDQLRTDMMTAVHETMQPSHVSVWLR